MTSNSITHNYLDLAQKDLDTHFIGQWDVHHVDKYGSVKAGTNSRTTVVRSRIDQRTGVIILVAHLPDRNGVTDIIMDGSTGFHSKISERITISKDDEYTRVDCLYIKLLTESQVRKEYTRTGNGYRVWETVAELDDVVYNQNDAFRYPFYYLATDTTAPKLVGMYVEIPIADFNEYVRMRDLWFKNYKGARVI